MHGFHFNDWILDLLDYGRWPGAGPLPGTDTSGQYRSFVLTMYIELEISAAGGRTPTQNSWRERKNRLGILIPLIKYCSIEFCLSPLMGTIFVSYFMHFSYCLKIAWPSFSLFFFFKNDNSRMPKTVSKWQTCITACRKALYSLKGSSEHRQFDK